MSDEILRSVEAPVNENIPDLRSGDVVNVHVRIKEGSGAIAVPSSVE